MSDEEKDFLDAAGVEASESSGAFEDGATAEKITRKNKAKPKPKPEDVLEDEVASTPAKGRKHNEDEDVEDNIARDLLSADAGPEVQRKVRSKGRQVSVGIAHIKATFNNTMVAISDMQGGVVAWSTAGRAGFKGSRKSTSFAATLVGQDAARQAISRGMHEVEVRVQGAGGGRESAVRALQSSGLNITIIKDVTPIPHNGCRPRKRRRV